MISHHHKTLFVHIPKCGGQSVELAFLNDLGLSWRNRAPLLLRPRVDGENAPPRLAHLLLRDYLENRYLSRSLFDAYYKFSVVRCPYRRVISFYTYFKTYKTKKLDRFVSDDLPLFLQPSHEMYWFFQPQYNYLIGLDRAIGVDEVYHLENLSGTWERIYRKIGLSDSALPHVNKTSIPGFGVNDLSFDSASIIRELYLEDFVNFPQYDVGI